ncbi:MAG: exopolysaccharide biosynthesis polyprenyl glycosylphosphotransferase [Candidatus Fermentibacter sp.]|nr:exopolysaccharide biosynthesis polyprenyl glycosylphosphotransferase [Candidatus Fermentibacter sp.]
MGREKGIRLDGAYSALSLACDSLSIAVAVVLASVLRHGPESIRNFLPLVGTWGFYSVITLLLSDMESVYHARTSVNRSLLAYRLIRIALIVTVLYVIAAFVFRLPSGWFLHSRLVIATTFLFWCIVSFLFRLGLPSFVVLLAKLRILHIPDVRILACGDPEVVPRVRAMLDKSPLYRRFLHFIPCPVEGPGDVAGRLRHYVAQMRECGCDDLCIAEDGMDFDTVAPFIIECFEQGISLSIYSSTFETLGYYDSWISFPERPALVFFTPPMSRAGEAAWRILDIVLSSLALLALLPLFGLVAVLIRLNSPGPVFFRQKRVGLGGRLFVFYKFRSMRNTTSSNVKAHKDYFAKYARGIAADSESDSGFKLRDDNRVTWTGRIIRKTSIDELPQFLNVLKGDMSLVGPRPCIAYEMDYYRDWQRYRFSVRPGLTGIWQVYGRSRLPFDAAQFLDLCYALKRSTGLNIRLLLKTIPVVLFGRGGY